jgi:ketosteroid isomerase-like protein
MKCLSISFVGASLVALAACEGRPTLDLEVEREGLLAADQAWSQSDLEEQFAFLADDAMYLGEGIPLVSGRDAIEEAWREEAQLPGFSLSWEPDGAVVSARGDLGYTFGSNEISLNNAAGVRTTTKGKYVTIWRKQADGSWKVVVDIANSDAPPTAVATPKP